jgi:hypothetical protein
MMIVASPAVQQPRLSMGTRPCRQTGRLGNSYAIMPQCCREYRFLAHAWNRRILLLTL